MQLRHGPIAANGLPRPSLQARRALKLSTRSRAAVKVHASAGSWRQKIASGAASLAAAALIVSTAPLELRCCLNEGHHLALANGGRA